MPTNNYYFLPDNRDSVIQQNPDGSWSPARPLKLAWWVRFSQRTAPWRTRHPLLTRFLIEWFSLSITTGFAVFLLSLFGVFK